MKDVYTSDYIVLDVKTGEAVQYEHGFTVFAHSSERASYQRELVAEYGNFIWLIFDKSDPFVFKLSPASLAKLLFLSTFIDYDNALMLKSRGGSKNKAKERLTMEDMRRELRLSSLAFKRFYSEVSELGILYRQNNRYYISKDFFRKGRINKNYFTDTSEKSVFRVFISSVQSMYRNLSSSQKHYLVGFLARMLPYTNKKYNVVCGEPCEINAKRIKALSFLDICKEIGHNPSDARHLYQRISRITFRNKSDNINRPLAKVKGSITKWKSRVYIFINPYLFYGGSDINDVSNFGSDLKL